MDYKRVTTAYVAVLMSVVLSNAFCLVAKFTLVIYYKPLIKHLLKKDVLQELLCHAYSIIFSLPLEPQLKGATS